MDRVVVKARVMVEGNSMQELGLGVGVTIVGWIATTRINATHSGVTTVR